MIEEKYHVAEDVAAAEMAKLYPPYDVRAGASVPVSASVYSRTKEALVEALAARVARQKGVVDMLFQTELSGVPMPDSRRSSIPTPSGGRR